MSHADQIRIQSAVAWLLLILASLVIRSMLIQKSIGPAQIILKTVLM